jgi:hypothetical protein
MMKTVPALLAAILLASCGGKNNDVAIRKIPCENKFDFTRQGQLQEPLETLYYAVEYTGDIPMETIRTSADIIIKTPGSDANESRTLWFYKDSPELQKITSCDSAAVETLLSGQRQIALFFYDGATKTVSHINFEENGEWGDFQPGKKP